MSQQNHLQSLPEDLQQFIWHNVWRDHMKTIQREIKIEFVLKQFKGMIGEPELALSKMILNGERQKLQNYEKYYRYWCDDISSWCH